MIEILFLIWFGQKIRDIARAKGRSGAWAAVAVAVWLVCEFSGFSMGQGSGLGMGSYVVGLIFAAFGAGIFYVIVDGLGSRIPAEGAKARSGRGPVIFVALGGATAILGSVLPWTKPVFGDQELVSGLSYVWHFQGLGEGVVTLVAGVIALMASLACLVSKGRKLVSTLGAVALACGSSASLLSLSIPYPRKEVGVFLVVLGGAFAAAGGVAIVASAARSARAFAAAALIGGALAVVGSVLPWAKAPAEASGSISGMGFAGGGGGVTAGVVTLTAAALVVALATFSLARKAKDAAVWTGVGVLACGFVVAAISITSSPGSHSQGGLWLVVLGGVVASAASPGMVGREAGPMPLAPIAVAVGGAAAVLGSFLPWNGVVRGLDSMSWVGGLRYGFVTVIIGAVAMLLALVSMTPLGRGTRGFAGFAAGLLVTEIVFGHVAGWTLLLDSGVGIGLWLAGAGAVAALAGGAAIVLSSGRSVSGDGQSAAVGVE